MSYKETIRRLCPNLLPLRKLLARMKLREYARYRMLQEEINCGENSVAEKESLVASYAAKWPEYTEAVDEKIEEIFNRAPNYKERKDLAEIKMDMRFCRFAYGFQPDEYLSYGLELKNQRERQMYVSDVERLRYEYQMNDIVDYGIFNYKEKTYEKFAAYFHRDAISIQTAADYPCFAQFVEKHPVFVKKRVDLAKGDGVALVDSGEWVSAQNGSLEDLFQELISEGKLILEERVIQGAALSALNASSVNTVRCGTFLTREEVAVMFCFLKVGQGGSFIDNGGAGGILIGIDKETGVLNTDGFDEFICRYEKHPDTGVSFQGYQLPMWEQLLATCKEMAMVVPSVKCVGWDMAYTDEGWILIEGNALGQVIGPQIVWQRGIKKELLEMMTKMDLLA